MVSLRGSPPSELMAKLWVTPLRTPRRPVSSEARDGEHVEAAEWKSTNLRKERILQLTRACSHTALSLPAPLHTPPFAQGMRMGSGR